MDYLLHKANGTDTAELNKQVGGFSAISSVLVKLNHNKVGEMELKLSAPAYTIAIGDWVEAKGKRFYCLNNWKEYIPGEFSVTLLTVEGFGLTSNFYHCIESFDTVYSWSRDNNKVDTGSLKTFGEFFCYNVNYQQNTRLFKVGSYPEGMDTDYRVLSFTNENALSCLYEICTAYGVRYEFVLNEDEDSLYILNFYAEDVVYPETFSYEKQGGLYDLNISNADGQVYTEFVILGSEDNLPADYPYTELHLPDDYPLSMVKYPDKYATWGRSVKELRLDVKPSRVGSVTAEVSGDLNSFIDSDLISATWTPVGGVIHIVEGPLLGFEFNVSDFNADTGKVTVEQNTENAITLPEAEYYKFTEGTKYTITGIPLPESYLTTAEENLLSESEPHRLYWSDSRYDARIRVKPKFLETNGEIEAGMLLPVVHEAINLNRNFRVQSITYDPRKEQYYDVTEITISDFRQESIADSQHKAIRTALHRLDDADKVSTSIKTSIKNLDTYIDGAFADGLVSEAEAKAIEKYINIVNSQKSDIDAQFTALYANSYLSGDPKTNLNSAKAAINTATTNLLNSINTAIADGAASEAEKADVDSKFTAFNSALSTYQTRVEEAKGAIEAAIEVAANDYTNEQLSDYAEVVTGSLGDLQNQIDGKITTWFYAYVPTTANAPASDWTTTALKNQHLGDLFYDTETGYCYRFQLSGETYSWVKITDTDVTKALADAAAAQDTADSKRRVFVATPVTPYDIGDLWLNNQELYKCRVTRLTGSYVASDWEKGVKYTDDTAADAVAAALSDFEGVVTSSINGLQSQIDGVVDSWFNSYVPTTYNYPASEWTTTELKQGHVGDTFTNTQAYVDEATTPDAGKSWRWVENSGVYSWTPIADSDAVKALLAASTAQDTADGKRRVFTTTPTTPYDKGDLWSGGASGDLKISTTTRAVGSSYVAGDWVLATKYTDDTAANAAAAAAAAAQSAADDAQDDADAANALLTNIASDSKLTASEKQAAQKEWDIIQAEKTKNDTQADLYSVSKTVYTNAYNALNSYLSTLLSNLTTTSNITGSEFRGKFKDYYNARTDLLNAISNAAKAAAEATAAALDDAIQVGGRNLILKSATTKGWYNDLGVFIDSPESWISDFIEVSEGKEYTAKSFNSTNNVGGRLIYFDADKTYVTRGERRVEETFVIPTGIGYIRYQSDKVGGVYVDDAIIVKGNKATDWTPAPEDVQAEIDAASDAVNALDTFVNGTFKDGVFTAAEAKSLSTYINTVNSQKSQIDSSYATIYNNSYLTGTAKTNLASEKTLLNTAFTNLLNSITTAIADGNTSAAEKADVDSKFTAFNSAISTYQTRVEEAQEAIHAAAAKAYTDGQLSDYAEVVTGLLGDLQNQIDGNITTFFYAYVPTLSNTPASDWTTTETKNQHLGDLFYDTETGYCYRYQLSGATYSWQRITDTDVTTALANAAAAQDTADNKRRVFVATPTTPYEVGDLWTGGESGDLKRCKVERLTGAYNASDWELATKYTDNTEAINAKRDAVNAAKEQADAIYTKVYANAYLTGDPKTNLNTAKTSFNTAVSELLSALSSGTDVESKIFAYDSAVSAYYIKVQEAQEAISAAMKILAENAAKSYADAQDILLKEKTDAYADGVATAAEEAAIEAAQLKVDAAKLVWEAYADGVVSDEEAARIADAQAKYEAALNYADSLADGLDSDSTAKVTAAKNALAAKFGYTDWAAMEAAASLIGGMTTSAGLINANVIDVTTLAALDAFIEELVVIKLETAVDEDGTKVRIDADAVDGRAGVLLEENTGDKGIKLYYKDSSGVPVFNMYSVSTGELLEFLANRMKFSKGSTKDITIDSNSTILQLRSSTNYAQITPSTLRVDGLATAPVGKGHFWVDTEGYVHHGMEVPPTTTYSFDIDVTYPTSRSDIPASGGTATFTVKLKTITDGTPDAGVLVDLDTGYPSVTSSPTGTSFSITRTGTGTYSITAASRGTVEDLGTAAVISVKYTPSGATQQSTSFNILQEANSKTKIGGDTGITLSISTIYDDTDCLASGDTWTVTASGESGGREEYTYTSGASGWVSLGGTPITASLISITTSGTGLSGSGTGAGTSVTWADRGTITGERRSGTITASYSRESESVTVYQGHNEIESTSNHVIESVSLNGVNGNVEVDADATYIDPDVRLSYTETYTSGATYDYESYFNDVYSCGKSVSGTGFSITGNRVNITENTGSSTRNGTLTITYKDATPVQRTITQAAASATTYQILGKIAYSSGSQIPASGGTATLTVTKQTYINGVHQSASDVLIDCDSGYPDLVSQPTGCDVSISKTGVGTYTLSAESRGTTVNSGTDIAIDLQATISGSAKTDSVIVIQQANALASSTGYTITSVTLDGVNDDIDITKSAQTITVLGSGTYTKTYTSGASESANFNLGASDISVSGTGFSYSNFTISVAANSGAERTCTVTASYSGATNVTRTITQAMGIVAPSLSLDIYSLSGNTLTLKASVSSAGGGTITACGFEHGNTSSLGLDVSASTVQSGQFTADVLVIAGKTIYWRAYATNEAGTTYTTITNYTHSGTPIEE